MSLKHEFLLVPKTVEYQDLLSWRKKKLNVIDSVDVPDDLIQYISDSLEWIPSENPARSITREEYGINYYGVTLFNQSSSEIMKSIFASWRTLFINSPQTLVLTGNFIFPSNEQEQGENERLVFKRDEVLKLLEKVILMAGTLEEGDHYIYHLGI